MVNFTLTFPMDATVAASGKYIILNLGGSTAKPCETALKVEREEGWEEGRAEDARNALALILSDAPLKRYTFA
jgi:hypothetical protein